MNWKWLQIVARKQRGCFCATRGSLPQAGRGLKGAIKELSNGIGNVSSPLKWLKKHLLCISHSPASHLSVKLFFFFFLVCPKLQEGFFCFFFHHPSLKSGVRLNVLCCPPASNYAPESSCCSPTCWFNDRFYTRVWIIRPIGSLFWPFSKAACSE